MYFYLHIISLLIILFLPIRPQAHIQRQPQTLNSVKNKTDWYLQEKLDMENHKTLERWDEKARGFSGDWGNVYMLFFFFLSAGSIFIMPFYMIKLAMSSWFILIFYRRFEWGGGMWRMCQSFRKGPFWAAASLLFWHGFQPLKSWMLGPHASAPEVDC